jgi:hypothetical protein
VGGVWPPGKVRILPALILFEESKQKMELLFSLIS